MLKVLPAFDLQVIARRRRLRKNFLSVCWDTRAISKRVRQNSQKIEKRFFIPRDGVQVQYIPLRDEHTCRSISATARSPIGSHPLKCVAIRLHSRFNLVYRWKTPPFQTSFQRRVQEKIVWCQIGGVRWVRNQFHPFFPQKLQDNSLIGTLWTICIQLHVIDIGRRMFLFKLVPNYPPAVSGFMISLYKKRFLPNVRTVKRIIEKFQMEYTLAHTPRLGRPHTLLDDNRTYAEATPSATLRMLHVAT